MDYIDYQYCLQLGTYLKGFIEKRKNPFQWNFRCNLCGDSEKNERKKRAWIIEYSHDNVRFFCHNCQESHSLKWFMKQVDPDLYRRYVADKFLAENKSPATATPEPSKSEFDTDILRKPYMRKISTLKSTHPAKKYVDSRMIPARQHYKLFLCTKFIQFLDDIDYPHQMKGEHPRLILPWFDRAGKVFALSARAFDPKSIRYISLKFRTATPHVYGLDSVDFTKRFYITEGPVDSLCIDNAIAMGTTTTDFRSIPNIEENGIVVLDNEKRNPDVLKQYEKVIKEGLRICIWPDTNPHKDINAMIVNGGMTPEAVMDMIELNTYSGLRARLEFSKWRKRIE